MKSFGLLFKGERKMRYFVYENGGVVEGSVMMSGMSLTNFLKLRTDPVENDEVSTRRYVLDKTNNFSSSQITRDTFSLSLIPEFSGDVVTNASFGTMELTDTGVVSTTFNKVVVDSKGRITAGEPLVYGDIPNLSWNQIKDSTKPTDLAGYGITDVTAKTGTAVAGDIRLHRNPIGDSEAATIDYLTSVLTGVDTLIPGQLLPSLDDNTPAGMLRANGASVLKSAYPELYAKVGDRFSKLYLGAGKPWLDQYGINDQVVGTLSGWLTSDPIPEPLRHSVVALTDSKVFILGGFGTTAGGPTEAITDIFSANIDAQGNIQTWSKVGDLPEIITSATGMVIKGRLYVFGGNAGASASDRVWSCPIDVSGNLGSWTASLNLPAPNNACYGFSTENKVFLFGASNGDIFVGDVDAGGAITSWTTSLNTLPVPVILSKVTVIKDKVFVIGGYDGTSQLTTVYSSSILSDGTLGVWSETLTPLPEALMYGEVFTTTNDIWYIGGVIESTGASSDKVYRSPINPDGTLGGWVLETERLPAGRSKFSLVATSSKLYLIGGWGTTSTDTVVHLSLPGGKNNLEPYYDAAGIYESSDSFSLPDYQGVERPEGTLYIKY